MFSNTFVPSQVHHTSNTTLILKSFNKLLNRSWTLLQKL